MNSPTLTSDDEVTSEPETSPDGGSLFRRPIRLRWPMAHQDGIVTGLSADIAERLGVDPLWVRLAFVASALLEGLGLIVYVGLWLALILARSTAVRVLGWAIIVGGVIVLTRDELDVVTGPVAVIGLLAGLALTLWQPVPASADGATSDDPMADTDASVGVDAQVARTAAVAASDPNEVVTGTAETSTRYRPRSRRRDRARTTRPFPAVERTRRRRSPSVLGQATVGVATIVAATGALIDELNGGRLHPEQWLGAAVVVCGLGLLVGTIRGHARWLIVPAAALAVVGYGAGVMARIGVSPTAAFASAQTWVSPDSSGTYRAHTGFGSAYVIVQDAFTEQVTVDVRTANGTELSWNPEVAVEIRSELGPVTMSHNGAERTASTLSLGPGGEPDVIVDLRMARGMVRVYDDATYDDEVPSITEEGAINDLIGSDGPPNGPIVDVGDGIAVTADGWIIVSGYTLLDEFNNVVYGDSYSPDGMSLILNTDLGEYRIVGQVLFTPDRTYYDLDELRNRRPDTPPATASGDQPTDTAPPTDTVPPAGTATGNDSNGLNR